jgi:hypothetical protein
VLLVNGKESTCCMYESSIWARISQFTYRDANKKIEGVRGTHKDPL